MTDRFTDRPRSQNVFLELTTMAANGEEAVEGESSVHRMGQENTEKFIECLEFEHDVRSGANRTAEGWAFSPTALGPVRIRKQIDGSSPVLARMLTMSEDCTAKFYFYRQTATGQGAENYYQIILENARVVRIQGRTQVEGHPLPCEEVEFAYSRINWQHMTKSKSHAFDWNNQGASHG